MRSPHDRLNGWKEIAAHLGKGVRTVQRWEHQYGLPVHRLGEEAEIVFAFASEIDEWAERRRSGSARAADEPSAAQAPPAAEPVPPEAPPAVDPVPVASPNLPLLPSPVRRPLLVVAAMLAVALAIGGWSLLGIRDAGAGGSDRVPASWEFRGDALRITDERGALLWQHRFESALQPRVKERIPADMPPVRIADLDGDGHVEIIVSALFVDRSKSRLEWFDEAGRLLVTRRPSDTVHFGDDAFAAPWVSHRTWITDGPGQSRSVWASFIHGSWFPTLLEEYAPDGRLRNRYWSNGYISWVGAAAWQGRPVVFVGASANEFGGGSLAVLPREWGSASAPAEIPKYRCVDCSDRRPLEFLVFPPSCAIASLHGTADVVGVNVDALGRLVVSVEQLPIRLPPHLQVKYTLSPDLSEATLDVTAEFVVEHERRWRAGEVDHPFDETDAARMLPVRRWTPKGFVPLAVHRD